MFFIAVRCAAFQVCDQSSAGKAPMCFPFLSLCSACPAPKPLCCTPVFPLREQSWAGGWEGQRQGGWPEGYSILPFIGLGWRRWWCWGGCCRQPSLRGRTGKCLLVGGSEQLPLHDLWDSVVFFPLYLPLSSPTFKLSFFLKNTSFICFFLFGSPVSHCREVSEQLLWGPCCWL